MRDEFIRSLACCRSSWGWRYPGFGVVVVIAAVPVLVSMGMMIALGGVETRDRPLEEMSMEPDPEPEELAAVAAG